MFENHDKRCDPFIYDLNIYRHDSHARVFWVLTVKTPSANSFGEYVRPIGGKQGEADDFIQAAIQADAALNECRQKCVDAWADKARIADQEREHTQNYIDFLKEGK